MQRVRRWILANKVVWVPRLVVAWVGGWGLYIAVSRLVRAASALERDRVRLNLMSRGVGDKSPLGDVPAFPLFVTALVLVVTALVWVAWLLIRGHGPGWFVAGLPTVAVAIDSGAGVVLLAGQPDVSGWGIAGGVFNALLMIILVGGVTLSAWLGLRALREGKPAPDEPVLHRSLPDRRTVE
ncbi:MULTISPECIES: hypothetical protein [Microbacterium]|uniref:hypothetical protein n=1 Tax=Microbacterium TaxID=33882 RepID=UPI0010741B48|nr:MULTISPECIES: hypothetical protein [Microbacterium]